MRLVFAVQCKVVKIKFFVCISLSLTPQSVRQADTLYNTCSSMYQVINGVEAWKTPASTLVLVK